MRDPREFATAAYPLRASSLPALVLQGVLDQVRETPDGLGLFDRQTGRTDGTQMPNGSAYQVAACSVVASEPVAPAALIPGASHLARGAGPSGGPAGAFFHPPWALDGCRTCSAPPDSPWRTCGAARSI